MTIPQRNYLDNLNEWGINHAISELNRKLKEGGK